MNIVRVKQRIKNGLLAAFWRLPKIRRVLRTQSGLPGIAHYRRKGRFGKVVVVWFQANQHTGAANLKGVAGFFFALIVLILVPCTVIPGNRGAFVLATAFF